MNRFKLNVIINTAAFFAAIGLVLTGFVLEWGFPEGPAGRQTLVWGVSKHDWSEAHFVLALTCVAIVALHWLSHAAWFRAVIRGSNPARAKARIWAAAIGAAALIALVISPFLPMSKSVKQSGGNGEHRGYGGPGPHGPNGDHGVAEHESR